MVTEAKMKAAGHKLNAALNRFNTAIRETAAMGMSVEVDQRPYNKFGPSFGAPQIGCTLAPGGPRTPG